MNKTETKIYKELKKQVLEIIDRPNNLSEDNAFTAWFIKAYITDDDNKALDCLTGGPNDRGVDAVYIDHETKIVFVIQCKYRQSINLKNESLNDIIGLANIGRALLNDSPALIRKLLVDADELTRKKLLDARRVIQNNGFKLQLQFVSTGKVNNAYLDSANAVIEDWDNASYEFYNGEDILTLCENYIEGFAPPPPTIKLPLDKEINIERYDDFTGNTSWIFTMNGSDIGDIYNKVGKRLFARNIRGFLGDTLINKSIQKTLTKEPHLFWYYNNGITIIGNKVKLESVNGESSITISNAQIINGQQTTRILSEYKNKNAKVLVKLIQIPSKLKDDNSQFDHIVNHIVKATNYQNQISESDLKSNDVEQIRIERELRKLNYSYVRKRYGAKELLELKNKRYLGYIMKDKLAKIIAACLFDPYIVRKGKNKLFVDEIYKKLFNGSSVRRYLTFYWLNRIMSLSDNKDGRRYYAHWLVLNFIWSNLEPFLKDHYMQKKFISIAERNKSPKYKKLIRALSNMTEKAYIASMAFYRLNKAKTGIIKDVSTFFYQPNLHIEFSKFWDKQDAKMRRLFKKNVEILKNSLEEIELD